MLRRIVEIDVETEDGVPVSLITVGNVSEEDAIFVLAGLYKITKELKERLCARGIASSFEEGLLRNELANVIAEAVRSMEKEDARRLIKAIIEARRETNGC
jgi:hypothetical protein